MVNTGLLCNLCLLICGNTALSVASAGRIVLVRGSGAVVLVIWGVMATDRGAVVLVICAVMVTDGCRTSALLAA